MTTSKKSAATTTSTIIDAMDVKQLNKNTVKVTVSKVTNRSLVLECVTNGILDAEQILGEVVKAGRKTSIPSIRWYLYNDDVISTTRIGVQTGLVFK